MIDLKTPQEIAVMREGGKRLGTILQQLLAMAEAGVTLSAIDAVAFDLIAKAGGTPSFTTVKGYKWATCLCVNDVVVHGIPTPYTLKPGDVLTIDVGLVYEGFHTDTAWTKIIPGIPVSPEVKKFVDTGEQAVWNGIAQAKLGNRIGHISKALQDTIEGAGYSVVRSLIGHGVGRELHEDPQVPGFLRGPIEKTQELKVGETIAIEIIYAQGRGDIEYANTDGWTLATKDGSLASVFEHSIAIMPDGGVTVLTSADETEQKGRKS